VRLPSATIEAINDWRKRGELKTRSEAIRRLVELGLDSAGPFKPLSEQAASQATKLADREIDRLSDKSATDEERESRKRRLLKGPKEFRELRARKRK
jgi:Arc/MetJ-type ribon-helix-helix transcriptional regulator